VTSFVSVTIVDCHSNDEQRKPFRTPRAEKSVPNFGSRRSSGSPKLAVQSFFAADTSTQTIAVLPSWSAITVSEVDRSWTVGGQRGALAEKRHVRVSRSQMPDLGRVRSRRSVANIEHCTGAL
jgi:hypothetical protein